MSNRVCLLLVALLLAVPVSALDVVATTSDLGWFAREIGGDRVKVDVIALGTQDPHYIEPKPSYLVKLRKADLVLYNGLDLEIGWLPRLLDGAHNPDIQDGRPGLFAPTSSVDVLEVPTSISRAEGDVHPDGNPHYTLSPANAVKVAHAIGERLALVDADGAEGYQSRAESLARRIETRDAEWRRRLEGARGVRLITYHRTYSYFLDHFGLVAADVIEQRPGVPPSARHLAQLIQRARKESVALILLENFFEPRDGRFVGERAHVTVVEAPVAVGGEKGIDSWFDLLERLVTIVETAVGNPRRGGHVAE